MSKLPTGWNMKPLGKVATLQRGFDLPVQSRHEGTVPIFAANGPVGTHDVGKAKGPGVVTGRSGTLGKVHFVETDFWPLNTALWVKDFHGNDPAWISRLLTWMRLEQFTRGAGVPTLNRNLVHVVEIALPPLAEQKRIAGILDAADALRAKRRGALAQLDTLLQSTFLDMFGDPVTNPMGWPVDVFDSWLDNIDSGWSPTCPKRKADDDEWGVLKLGAVTWCEFDETAQKALPPDLAPRPEIEVRQGDLLFTRKNTYDLVAAVAYVHAVRPKLMLPDLIFRLRLKPEVEVESTFLWQLLIEPHQRQTIQKLAGGAAGSMPNISKAKLKTVKLIKPPLDLQRRFATIVESVEQQNARMRAHLTELDALFASLQDRAFKGEL